EREYSGRDESRDSQRQDDLDQDLEPVRSVDERAFLELEGNGLEIAHQEPGGEWNQERRIGQDQREPRVEEIQLVDHGRQRDEQNRWRHQVGEKDAGAEVTRTAVAQPLDGIGGKSAAE